MEVLIPTRHLCQRAMRHDAAGRQALDEAATPLIQQGRTQQFCSSVGRQWLAQVRKVAALVILLLLWASLGAAQSVPKNYQIQAVFLWRLAQFTEWPVAAFDGTNSPIIIGVLGDDPFDQALDLAVKDETAHHRKIEVRRFRRADEVSSCHILFISRSEEKRVANITRALGRRPILTVSDIDEFHSRYGGMISFVSEQSKVRLRINVDAVKSAGITLAPQLLRMNESGKR